MRDLWCEPVRNDYDSRQIGDHYDASDNASAGHDATGPRCHANDSVDSRELSHGAPGHGTARYDRTVHDFAGQSCGDGAPGHGTADHESTAHDHESGRRRGWSRVLGAWMSGARSECPL